MRAVLSSDRKKINFYDSFQYKELIKRIPGREYDRKEKSWKVPVNYDSLKQIKNISPRICEMPEEIDLLYEELSEEKENKDKETLEIKLADSVEPISPVPVRANLFMHQIKGYNLALQNDSFGFLFEMGTGKTLTAISTIGRRYLDGQVKKVLIVCPTSIVPVWPKEFDKFAGFNYEAVPLLGTGAKKRKLLQTFSKFDNLKVAVINYESAWRMVDELKEFNPDMIVCDESQRIKTHNSKQSKGLHELGDVAKYKLILTGTPVQNNAIDFWSQYRFLNSEVFGKSFYAFKARYAVMGGYEGRQIVGYAKMDELIEKAHSVAFRVTKEEAVDLPEQIFTTRYCELEPSAMRVYNEIKKESYVELERGEITASNVLTKLLRLSQITGGFIADDDRRYTNVSKSKIKELEDIINDVVIESDKKLVIFARFIPEIKAIRSLIEKLGIDYEYISGEVKDRGLAVDRFQQEKDCKIFIAQLQVAGLGITLTAADTAVFYSLDFNYANYSQALARTHRIGQKNKCTYIHLISPKTVDERIMEALNMKGNIAKMVVDNWRNIFK